MAPIFKSSSPGDQWPDKLIHYRDAYAFSHLFALCQRIGAEPSIVPYNKVAEYEELGDIFCIGGPVSNELTSYYLKSYLPGLRMVDASKQVVTSWRDGGGFMVGETDLFETEGEQFAILVKIGEQQLGQQRTVHLLFGYGAVGTAAAGYYLWKHFAQIHRRHGRDKYCIAIKVIRKEGYKSVRASYDDYTDAAFQKPKAPTVSGTPCP